MWESTIILTLNNNGGLIVLPHLLRSKLRVITICYRPETSYISVLGLPTYIELKNVLLSATRSPYGGYFHGIQSKMCESRTYLKNSVPIFKISQKLAWKFSFATETMRKKKQNDRNFFCRQMDVINFLTWRHFRRFLIKNAPPGGVFSSISPYFSFVLSTSIRLSMCIHYAK